MALNLFSSDTDSDKIYKHDGFSASILDSFSSRGATPQGLTFDGTNIIESDSGSGYDKIYRHNGFSASILDCFSSPHTQPRGITHEYIGC